MKKIYLMVVAMLLPALAMASEGAYFDDYAHYDGVSTHDSRTVTSVTVADNAGNSVTVDGAGGSNKAVYADRTSTVLTVRPGATITVSATGTMEWMHGYVYVDFGQDGRFDVDQSLTTVNQDLVSHTGYTTTLHSNGTDTSDPTSRSNGTTYPTDYKGYSPFTQIPSFTLPDNMAPGEYRLRYKVDWNSTHPFGRTAETLYGNQGSKNFINANGGAIIDITIVVALEEHTVTIQSSDLTKGSVEIVGEGTTSVTTDQSIVISATPNPGYIFDGWYNDANGSLFSYDSTVTVSASSDISLTARFAEYPSMTMTFTSNSTQQNRYLGKVTTTGTQTPTVFEATSQDELPFFNFTATPGTYVSDGAVLDKTANPIIVTQGTTSFDITYYAWTEAIGNATTQLNWTQEAYFIDLDRDGWFNSANEIGGKGWTEYGNSGKGSEIITADGVTRTISLPADLQPGEYRLRVVFYEPNNNSDAWHTALFETGNRQIRNGRAYDFTIKVVEPTYHYTLAQLTNGTIAVKVNGEAISTDTDIAAGTEVTLEATPATGFKLDTFTANGEAFEGDTYTVNGDVEFGAIFSQQTFKVTFAEVVGGSIKAIYNDEEVTAETEITYGDEITLVATANAGYTFAAYTVDGVSQSEDKVTVTKAVELGATFTLNSYAVTFGENVTATDAEGNPVDAETLPYGTEITLSAAEVEGYDFVAFTVGDVEIEGNKVVIEGETTIGAKYTIKTFTVNYTQPEEGGSFTVMNGEETVESGAEVDWNTVLTIEATPAEGYELVSILNGETVVEGNTLTVTDNVDLTATFAKQTFKVTFAEVVGGSLKAMYNDEEVTAETEITYGDEITLVATANAGYTFEAYTVDGVSQTEDKVTVTKAMELGATFTLNSYAVTFGENVTATDAEGNPVDAETLPYGTEITLSAAEVEGYDFVAFTVGDVEIEGNKVVIEGETTIGAKYVIKTFTVTYTQPVAGGEFTVMNGENAVESGAEVDWNTVLTLEATPAAGYDFEAFTANGEAIEGNTYTVKNNVAFGANFAPNSEVLYFDNYAHVDAVSTHASRKLTTVTVADNAGHTVTVNGYGGQNNNIYADRTSTALTVQPGATITVSATGTMEWMHGYVYLDFGQDGRFDVDQSLTTVNNDLVSHTGYTTGLHANGSDTSDPYTRSDGTTYPVATYSGYTPLEKIPAFTIPADMAPGDYRLRYKIDWNSTHPYGRVAETIYGNQGNKNFINENGGGIVDITIRVTEPTYAVNIAEVENGSLKVMLGEEEITNGQQVEKGSELTLEATPAEGYELVAYTVDGENIEGNTVTVNAATTVGAVFAKKTFKVTFADVENGSLKVMLGETEVTAETEIPYGEEITLVATPDEDYEFVSFTVDGNETTEATLTVKDNVTLGATFAKVAKYVIWAQGVNGLVEVYSDAELTNLVIADNNSEDGTEGTVLAKDCQNGLFVKFYESDELRLATLRINGGNYTAEVENGVYHIADVTALSMFDQIGIEIGATYEVVEAKSYPMLLTGENGRIAVFADASLETLLAENDETSEYTEVEIPAKDCPDGLYIVVFPTEDLILKELGINGVDYIDQLTDNVLHITDIEGLPWFEDWGLIAIGATYEVKDPLAGLLELGIDLQEGDVEFYNLQGVRIATENVANGYYIVRQGNKTVKVYIRK